MAITRRQALGLGAAGTVAGGAAVGAGLWTGKMPGATRVGYWLQLGGDEVPMFDDPAGEIVSGSFTSPHRPGVAEPWAYSLPPGVPIKGLPVVVVLHGWRDDHRFCFDQLGMHHLQARIHAQGGKAFVLASLDGETFYWHRRSDGVDWARLVSEGLLGELEELGADTSRVALIGWSMGGFGALRLATQELHGRVRAVASMSTAIYRGWEHCPQGEAFDSPEDYARNTIDDRLDLLDGLPVHLACGWNDDYIHRNRWLRGHLHPTPPTLFTPGDHAPNFWRRAAEVQLPFLAQHL